MWNIFIGLMAITLAFAFFDPNFFVAYLISIAVFGLYQAIYMANAGGSWDNAKKYVEVDLKEKGTALHAATVVGDTVGDPFKDTSSVALNPVIKFTTLFGVLAVGLALQLDKSGNDVAKYIIFGASLLISMFFAHRSFYGMRILSDEPVKAPAAAPKLAEQPAPRAAEKTVEKAADKAAEKAEGTETKAAEKAAEKADEKATEKAAEIVAKAEAKAAEIVAKADDEKKADAEKQADAEKKAD
jgi:K(+)-stimulated pyrophosphate-energized sodium pump